MAQDRERKRAYDREREKRRPRRIRNRAPRPDYMRAWREAHRDYMRQWREEHREQIRANAKVNNARKAGRLTALPCEVCGSTEHIEAHHAFGYSPEMALAVWWLCKTHHEAMHNEIYWALKAAETPRNRQG